MHQKGSTNATLLVVLNIVILKIKFDGKVKERKEKKKSERKNRTNPPISK